MENDKEIIIPKFYSLKVIAKIILYTIITCIILSYSLTLFTKNINPEPISTSWGLAPSSTFEADPKNGTISVLITFVTLIIYTKLFIRELNLLEKNKKKILKYILVALFQIITFLLLMIYGLSQHTNNSLFCSVVPGTLLGYLLDLSNMFILIVPPILLTIVNAVNCIKDIITFFVSKFKK